MDFRVSLLLLVPSCSGPFEAQGNFAGDFDILHDDLWLGQDSFERQKKLLEQAWKQLLKSRVKKIFSFLERI